MSPVVPAVAGLFKKKGVDDKHSSRSAVLDDDRSISVQVGAAERHGLTTTCLSGVLRNEKCLDECIIEKGLALAEVIEAGAKS